MAVEADSSFIKLLREKGKRYISAMILGLNDALIEFTAALAGFTMVLPDNRSIVLAGLTTGVAATLSMAASEYLSQEADSHMKRPILAAGMTGLAYFITVAILIFPFIIFKNSFIALAFCILAAAVLIFVFTFFEAQIRRRSFSRLCVQMLGISFGAAVLSFCISWAAEVCWGIDFTLV